MTSGHYFISAGYFTIEYPIQCDIIIKGDVFMADSKLREYSTDFAVKIIKLHIVKSFLQRNLPDGK